MNKAHGTFNYLDLLDLAHNYAKTESGCCKVAVGSVIVEDKQILRILAFGANKTLPVNCKSKGCLRIQKYGNDDKTHRNPDDCRAIHSEIAAISAAARQGISLEGATIVVTRYPCEACARAIVEAGIQKVVYGREQTISQSSYDIFKSAKVTVIHCSDWIEQDAIN